MSPRDECPIALEGAQVLGSAVPNCGHYRDINARLVANLAELQGANRRLEALTRLSLNLASERDMKVMLRDVCRGAHDVLQAAYVVLGIPSVSGKASQLQLFASGVNLEALSSQEKLHLNWCARSRLQATAGISLSACILEGLPASFPAGYHHVVAPVASLSRVYGWLLIAAPSEQCAFGDEQVQLAHTLAAQVGRIYESGSLYAEAQGQAYRLELQAQQREAAVQELRRSEQRFRQLAESINEVFWLSDAVGGEILYVSPAYDVIWGRPSENLYVNSQDWVEAVHPEDRGRVLQAAKSRASRPSQVDEYRIVRPDGSIRWIRDRAFAVKDEADRVTRYAGVAEDITASVVLRETLREREAGLHRAQEMARLTHVVTGTDGRFEQWPDTLPGMLGLTQSTMPLDARGWLKLVHPDDVAHVRERARQATSTGHRLEMDYRIRHADGRWLHVRQVMEPLGDEQDPCQAGRWFNTLQDTTEQAESERRVHRLNRLYAVLSGINTLIVRAQSEEELFRESCRVAVEAGGFRGAWIGRIDTEAQRIVPVTGQGRAAEFLFREDVQVTLGVDSAGMQSPIALAMSSGQPVFVNDLLADDTAIFRAQLRAVGALSLGVLPLVVAGRWVTSCSGWWPTGCAKALLLRRPWPEWG